MAYGKTGKFHESVLALNVGMILVDGEGAGGHEVFVQCCRCRGRKELELSQYIEIESRIP